MDFGEAIAHLKDSRSVRRAGWNGKGMHVYLEEHLTFAITKRATRAFEPVICLFTAQAKHQPGWVPSQADMLADDWELVSP